MALATIRDVAREAAVSVASVSRALNGHDSVGPAMRSRVQAAAAALGYVPHAGARNLSLARANAVGVVLPDLHGEFFSEILRGMDREASVRGLHLLLSNIHDGSGRSMEALATLRGRVDGLVLMAPHLDTERLFAALPPGLPVVLVNCAANGRGPELRVDNAGAAASMVEHLVASGRRRIVHIAGPQGNSEARERERGYRAAVAKAGLAARVLPGDFNEEAGVAAAETLLRVPDGVDAVFAANDMMAIGALSTLRRAGVDVPDDVAVAGFDDIPLARLISPALTTMRVGMVEMGARALALLVENATGDAPRAAEWCAPELVIRETTGASDNNKPAKRAHEGELL